MNIGSFFKLVEIQTKVASVLPFLLGTSYTLYKFDNFNIKNAVIMFLGMICFDMTTTAINNYIDYKKAIKKDGYGYEKHNAIVKDNIKPISVIVTIFIMLIISTILGLILVKNTNVIVLLLGVVSFIIGISYSFGPIPISRTPFGEVFSGLTMGFIITFLAVYIHIFNEKIVSISFINDSMSFIINIRVIIEIFIISIPAIMGISNIMLANNICDIEEDIENKRYTLPVYIGKKNALLLFKTIYYIAYVAISIGVVLKILPIISVISIITIIPVRNNIKAFTRLQTKKDTFILSVKNFILINLVFIISITFSLIIK
ncbi:1,4-dihydroxy-2-naphthoate polyprenyltransferase [Clostridium carnis]